MAGLNAQCNIPVEDKLLIYTARISRRTTFNMHKDYRGIESTYHGLNMRQFADKGYKLDKVRTIHEQ